MAKWFYKFDEFDRIWNIYIRDNNVDHYITWFETEQQAKEHINFRNKPLQINTFDCDGVIDFEGEPGIYPGPRDIILTGRSFEEREETEKMLRARNILNTVWYNPARFSEKTRETSGQHKANCIRIIQNQGSIIRFHFEDDPLQIEEIQKVHPELKIVHVKSAYVELENKRRINDD